jgi:hypothetical protein
MAPQKTGAKERAPAARMIHQTNPIFTGFLGLLLSSLGVKIGSGFSPAAVGVPLPATVRALSFPGVLEHV